MTSVRDKLVETFRKLILGPSSEFEILDSEPSSIYLTGILWPPKTEHNDEDDDNTLDSKAAEPEDVMPDSGVPIYHVFKPTSIGLTCYIEDNRAFQHGLHISPCQYLR